VPISPATPPRLCLKTRPIPLPLLLRSTLFPFFATITLNQIQMKFILGAAVTTKHASRAHSAKTKRDECFQMICFSVQI